MNIGELDSKFLDKDSLMTSVGEKYWKRIQLKYRTSNFFENSSA